MPWNGYFLDMSTEALQHFGSRPDTCIDVGMRVVLAKSLLHQADLHAPNPLADRLGVAVELETPLPRVVAIFSGHHLQKECVLGDGRRERSGMIDRRIHAH